MTVTSARHHLDSIRALLAFESCPMAKLGMTRRSALAAALASPMGALAAPALSAPATDDVVPRLLRAGGVVIAFRHALAPGTFDPPGFRLEDCATQRNLDHEGRAQAQRIGEWFRGRGLRPELVRSSPWCRCQDTARLAFGRADVVAELGSPVGADPSQTARAQAVLRSWLTEASRRPGRFAAWVTHMFVLSALTGESTASGEGLVLRLEGGAVKVLGRLAVS